VRPRAKSKAKGGAAIKSGGEGDGAGEEFSDDEEDALGAAMPVGYKPMVKDIRSSRTQLKDRVRASSTGTAGSSTELETVSKRGVKVALAEVRTKTQI
jgi:hypothetical protein